MIPTSIEYMHEKAFYYCTKLTKVPCLGAVKRVSVGAFAMSKTSYASKTIDVYYSGKGYVGLDNGKVFCFVGNVIIYVLKDYEGDDFVEAVCYAKQHSTENRPLTTNLYRSNRATCFYMTYPLGGGDPQYANVYIVFLFMLVFMNAFPL